MQVLQAKGFDIKYLFYLPSRGRIVIALCIKPSVAA